MGPVDHLQLERDMNKQLVLRATIRYYRISSGLSDPLLNSPGDCPKMQEGGRIQLGDFGLESGSNRQDRASSLTFLELGQ